MSWKNEPAREIAESFSVPTPGYAAYKTTEKLAEAASLAEGNDPWTAREHGRDAGLAVGGAVTGATGDVFGGVAMALDAYVTTQRINDKRAREATA